MNWTNSNKLGCAAFILFLLILAGIYFYSFHEAEEPTPTAPTRAVG